MDPDTPTADHAGDEPRDEAGHFRPGVSGNPRAARPAAAVRWAWPGRWPRPAWSRW
jgi:hypothetical protein